MRSIAELMKTGWPMLLSGIVVVLVLQGCTTPLVDVKVSMGEGCERSTLDGKGACIPIDASGQSAQNFLIANNHVPTTLKVTDAAIMCPAGSTKCAGLPGRCGTKPCKSWWDQTLNTCYCDCL